MEFPWTDNEERRSVLLVETDDADPESDEFGSEDALEPAVDVEVASPITSHVLAGCSQLRRTSKSTFKPPSTTDAVWTRVAFFDAAGHRLVLSAWLNKGSGNPYQTFIHNWYYDNRAAVRAVVLWNINETTWNRWAQC